MFPSILAIAEPTNVFSSDFAVFYRDFGLRATKLLYFSEILVLVEPGILVLVEPKLLYFPGSWSPWKRNTAARPARAHMRA